MMEKPIHYSKHNGWKQWLAWHDVISHVALFVMVLYNIPNQFVQTGEKA